MADVLSRQDGWARAAAGRIAATLRRALSEREVRGGRHGRVSLALAGGSTPEPVYRDLSAMPAVSWDRVEIFFGDERCVPPDHPESNFRMVREALLEPLGFSADRVHRMEAERDDRDGAAADYARILPPGLDLLLLGVGPDGHTASLFPGAPALGERVRLVVPVSSPAERGPARLTVTPPVLEAAARIVVLVRGPAKADAVARALEGAWDPRACPAQLARRGAWLLDAASAGRLEESETARPRPAGVEVLP